MSRRGGNQPAAARNSMSPFPVSPSGGKPGRGGFPPRREHAARQPKALARIVAAAPPTRGLPPPCASPAQRGVEGSRVQGVTSVSEMTVRPGLIGNGESFTQNT